MLEWSSGFDMVLSWFFLGTHDASLNFKYFNLFQRTSSNSIYQDTSDILKILETFWDNLILEPFSCAHWLQNRCQHWGPTAEPSDQSDGHIGWGACKSLDICGISRDLCCFMFFDDFDDWLICHPFRIHLCITHGGSMVSNHREHWQTSHHILTGLNFGRFGSSVVAE